MLAQSVQVSLSDCRQLSERTVFQVYNAPWLNPQENEVSLESIKVILAQEMSISQVIVNCGPLPNDIIKSALILMDH